MIMFPSSLLSDLTLLLNIYQIQLFSEWRDKFLFISNSDTYCFIKAKDYILAVT